MSEVAKKNGEEGGGDTGGDGKSADATMKDTSTSAKEASAAEGESSKKGTEDSGDKKPAEAGETDSSKKEATAATGESSDGKAKDDDAMDIDKEDKKEGEEGKAAGGADSKGDSKEGAASGKKKATKKRKRTGWSAGKKKKKTAANSATGDGKVISSEEGTFYEVQQIVDMREVKRKMEVTVEAPKPKKGGGKKGAAGSGKKKGAAGAGKKKTVLKVQTVVEYRVRWKGYGPESDTWEPVENLCDTAFLMAKEYALNASAATVFSPEGEGKEAGAPPATPAGDADVFMEAERADMEDAAAAGATPKEEEEEEEYLVDIDEPWEWTDAEQIQYRDIERISIDLRDHAVGDGAEGESEEERMSRAAKLLRQKIEDARLSGTPVCLIGHRGWAQFAKRWLKPIKLPGAESKAEEGGDADPAAAEKPSTEEGKKQEESERKPAPAEEEKQPAEGKAEDEKPAEKPTEEKGESEKPAEDKAQTEKTSEPEVKAEEKKDEAAAQGEEQKSDEKEPKKEGTEDVEMKDSGEKEPKKEEGGGDKGDDGSLLDLSLPYELDLDKMEEDIGLEAVPVVRRNYNEVNPISREISGKSYLRKCWRGSGSGAEDTNANTSVFAKKLGSSEKLYLHQWQFPLSETAAAKMCGKGKNVPLPHDILGGIDLLKYWLDSLPDSPYQYLFMGNAETKSRLHRDNGGLLISIAPIVGEKEVVLVHRSDGSGCLYHLMADLNKPDLHSFPLMSHARIWKSVIKPGEILLLPQGTYHQCRNVTPCLSYSRFFLDTVNLKPFLESFLDGDAPEITHDEVIWNASTELRDQLDAYTDKVRAQLFKKPPPGSPPTTPTSPPLTKNILRIVENLRALRNVVREVARRLVAQKHPEAQQWDTCVEDIDSTLHDFRHRKREKRPPFRPRRVAAKDIKQQPAPMRKRENLFAKNIDKLQSPDETPYLDEGKLTSLEKSIRLMPKLTPEQEGFVLSDSILLAVNDGVTIRLYGRQLVGKVMEVADPMKAALIRYEDLPSCHDGYHPIADLKKPVGGDSRVEIAPEDVQVGAVVIACDKGEEYRAVIQSWKNATFYRIRLDLGSPHGEVDRWITHEYVMERREPAETSDLSPSGEDGAKNDSAVVSLFPASSDAAGTAKDDKAAAEPAKASDEKQDQPESKDVEMKDADDGKGDPKKDGGEESKAADDKETKEKDAPASSEKAS